MTPAAEPQETSRTDEERVDLPITGMTCAACARTIERKLTKVAGVHKAGVNFATARATIEYDPGATGVQQFMRDRHERRLRSDRQRARRLHRRRLGATLGIEPAARAPRPVTARRRHRLLQPRHDGSSRRVSARHDGQGGAAQAIKEFGYRVRDAQGIAGDPEAAARHEEYLGLRRRLIVAVVCSLPVLVIAMSHGRIPWLDFPGVNWLQLALATPVVFYAGWQFYRGAWAAFRHRAADMNTLIAIGTGGALTSIRRRHGRTRFFAGTSHALMAASDADARRAGLLRGGQRDHRPDPRSGGCWSRGRRAAPATRSAG